MSDSEYNMENEDWTRGLAYLGTRPGSSLDALGVFGDHTADKSRSHAGGEQHLFFFDNGYGASVVQNDISYGREDGLWELAVLVGSVDSYDLTYSTPITDDVKGRLTVDDVADLLGQIEVLAPRQKELNA